MAFNREKLICYANNARTGVTPAYWKYDNTGGDKCLPQTTLKRLTMYRLFPVERQQLQP